MAQPQSLACRLGGDELCVLVPADECEGVEQAVLAFEECVGDCTVRASFGSVQVPEEGADTATALPLADELLYRHKSGPRTGPRGRSPQRPAA